ncbi:hypothetical protein BH11PLA2_BH11PLA2_33460 [soil metagenome]
MTDPFEDSWGDLAAEFGIDAPKPAPKPVEPEAEVEMPSDFEPAPADLAQSLFGDAPQAEALPDSLPDSLPDASDEEGGDTEVMEAGGDEAEKKRRRRRRRRGKKSDTPAVPGEPVEAEADEPDTVDDTTTQPSELLREIISKWDVPSWEEIVTGLHRPNR